MSDTESVESTSDYVSDLEFEETIQFAESQSIEIDPGFDSNDGYLTEVNEHIRRRDHNEPERRRIVRRRRRQRPIRQRHF